MGRLVPYLNIGFFKNERFAGSVGKIGNSLNKLYPIERISYRLAVICVAMTFVLGLLFGIAQVASDFRDEIKNKRENIHTILNGAKINAVNAALRLDEAQATEIVKGLFVYDFIVRVRINDEQGNALASLSRQTRDSSTRWLTNSFTNSTLIERMILHTPDDTFKEIGVLDIELDFDLALSSFYERSLFALISGVVRNIILGGLLVILFYFLVTRALLQLANSVAAADPNNLKDFRLAEPQGHGDDELGQLTKSINSFLQTISDSQNKQAQAEADLKKANDELELRVDERTSELLREITERKTAQEALRLSESRFRDIAESTSDWIWETDDKFRYVYFSGEAFVKFGWEPDILIGKTLAQLVKEGHLSIEGEEHNSSIEKMERHEPFKDAEFSIKMKNGEFLFNWSSGIPFFDESGKFLGYRGTTTDITARKLAQDKLRESEQTLRLITDNIPVLIAYIDSNLMYRFVNAQYEKDFGISRDQIVGISIKDLWGPTVFEKLAIYTEKVAAGEISVVEFESTVGGEADKSVTRRSTYVPNTDETGTVQGFYVLSEDITEARNREQELHNALIEAETANRSKSEFLANMSHELRTPLNAVIGFSELLTEKIFGDLANDRQKEYVSNIHESGHHLLNLINDVLDVSAIEAHKLELSEEDLALKPMFDSAFRMVNSRAESQGIEIKGYFDDSPPKIRVDERRMKQVLVNILSNAVKFTDENGSVTAGWRLNEDGTLNLSISDSGIGMLEEEIDIALQKFGQIKRADRDVIEGTGLGLPLTKGLVEAHGGNMIIQSIYGKGTTIEIQLPQDRVIV